MGRRNGDGARRKLLDLDALRPVQLRVRLGGAEHDMAPHDLEHGRQFAELNKRLSSSAEAADQLDAMREILAFLVPTARDLVGTLDAGQQGALIDFWAGEGEEERKGEEAEALAVAADPTSPG